MHDLRDFSDALTMASDGIWYAGDPESISYPENGNLNCFEVEDASFWFGHRNECITVLVSMYPPINNGRIFDIGAGNGYVSKGLIDAGFESIVVEPGVTGAANAKKRGLPCVICATTNSARFKPESLPAIGLFDVIEHIDSDIAFLTSMHQLLRPGGRVYATVPAYSSLWSNEDVVAGHCRRYTRMELCNALRQAGFEIEFASYFFQWLPALIFVLRVIPFHLSRLLARPVRQNPKRDHAVGFTLIAKLMRRIFKSEARRLLAARPLSFGASLIVVARKAN